MNSIIHIIRHTARAATALAQAARRATAALAIILLTATTAGAQDAITGLTYNSTGGYYEISDAQDLVDLANYVNGGNNASGKTFKQTQDIDMSSAGNFEPIGSQPNNYDPTPFNGTYDGQGYAIIGLTVNTSSPYAGLFGQLQGGSVRNLTMVNPNVTSNDNSQGYKYAGGIVGSIKPGTIENCNVINPTLKTSGGNGQDNKGAICGTIGGAGTCVVTDCYYYTTTNYDAVGWNGLGVAYSASRTYTLTLNDGITTSTAPTFSYGGTGYYASGTTITLPAPPIGWVYSYTVNGSPIDDNTFDISGNATVSRTAAHISPLLGYDDDPLVDGSAEHPYTIKTAEGWNLFCDMLAENAMGYFSSKTVRLGADITVTRMAGGSGHEFTGTFDGGGKTLTVNYANTDNNTRTAPFSYVDGATIQNLIVGGTISGTAYRAAGIIGETGNTTSHITNCVSNVDISSGRYTGGFSIGGNVEIEGCVFNGKIKGTTYSGGFIGYSYSAQVIKNSLFAPQDGSSISGGTFYYNGGGDVAPVNSYYTQALGTAQGKACHSVTAGTDITIGAIALTGTPTQYTVSGITAYSGGGLQRGQTLYYGQGDQLSLTLSNSATGAPQGYRYDTYTASAGTLAADGTLTMPDADVTITVSTAHLASTGQPVAVAYVDADGTLHDGNDAAQAVALDGSETSLGSYGQEKWYFGGIDFSHTGKITCYGDVHIILCDGKTMTVDGNGDYALWSPFGNFYFYGQNGQTGTLNATGRIDAADNNAGILTINGGIINASGDDGISAYDIIINRGTVNATGNDGHGIWSGGNITLGWNKPTDRISITASSYYGTVQVASGKKLHNGTDFLGGTLGDPAAVNGKTLRPAATATYTTADGTAATDDAILLDAGDNSLPAGNYLATGTLNYTHGITLTGNVTLILADNCHMNVGTSGEGRINDKGIFSNNGSSLNIYGQTNGNGALGIYTKGVYNFAICASAITINGGNITADTDGDNADALRASGGDLTINGGTVSATTTGTTADAICAYVGNFNYNGGNVTATAPNAYAIHAVGNYTFSWRTPADRITIGATGLYATAVKTATFTRLFTDATGNYYGATLTGPALNALKDVTLEAAETADFTVTLAPKGYGTYYDGHYDITLPAGTHARIVTARGATDGTLDYETIANGDDGITLPKTVPAGTAVMLCHDGGGSVTLTVNDADIDDRDFTKASGNTPGLVSLLHGSDVATETTGGTLYYKLTYGSAAGHEDIFGWYWGADDGAAFESPAHKAWLALPATEARSFIGLPEDETTGVTPLLSPEGDENGASPRGGLEGVAYYTLDGRKLDGTPMKPGIYVNNGKMVIIK